MRAVGVPARVWRGGPGFGARAVQSRWGSGAAAAHLEVLLGVGAHRELWRSLCQRVAYSEHAAARIQQQR